MCAILNKDLKHLIKEEWLLYQNFTDFCATAQGQKGVNGPKRQGAHCSCPQSTARLEDGVEQSQRLRATAGNHQGSHWDTALPQVPGLQVHLSASVPTSIWKASTHTKQTELVLEE